MKTEKVQGFLCFCEHGYEKNVSLEVEKLAEDAGHKVLWSPPCYSGLNGIEFSWAYLKGRVAKKYTKGIYFQEIEASLR